MQTLLEKARAVNYKKHQKRVYDMEDLELAIAWVNGEVSSTQVCKAKDETITTGNYLYYIAGCLKYFSLKGCVKISLRGK